jgi:hypothetical protein
LAPDFGHLVAITNPNLSLATTSHARTTALYVLIRLWHANGGPTIQISQAPRIRIIATDIADSQRSLLVVAAVVA